MSFLQSLLSLQMEGMERKEVGASAVHSLCGCSYFKRILFGILSQLSHTTAYGWEEREHNRPELMHKLFVPLIMICPYVELFRNKVSQVHCISIFRGSGNIPCILLERGNRGRT